MANHSFSMSRSLNGSLSNDSCYSFTSTPLTNSFSSTSLSRSSSINPPPLPYQQLLLAPPSINTISTPIAIPAPTTMIPSKIKEEGNGTISEAELLLGISKSSRVVSHDGSEKLEVRGRTIRLRLC